jgi:cytochrome c peroxidase
MTPAKVQLGQALFWDEQLSKTGTSACGTCHVPGGGGGDPRAARDRESSRHPGVDGIPHTVDDAIGTIGVPRHDADGRYLHSPHFGMAPQVGSRQALSMINAAFPGLLFWDGRAGGTFVDPGSGALLVPNGGALENQALGPLVNDVEMAHAGGSLADMAARIATLRPLRLSPSVPRALAEWIAGRDYRALFAEAFGTPEVTPARIALAIAAYQRTLVSNQTPHDLQLLGQAGAMTPEEIAGRQAFVQAGCARCHGGALLSDNAFHYLGVRPAGADPGRMAVTGVAADRGRMRTPSLRNVELSAPYMADGRFATLEEVVDFYDRGGDFSAPNKDPRMVPLNLTPQQRAAIVTFLKRPLTDPRVRDETGPFVRPLLYTESDAVPRPGVAGTPGAGGRVPRLIAIEPPLAGRPDFTIGVDQGRPNAKALAILAVDVPTRVDAPAILKVPFALSNAGSGSIDLALPAGTAFTDRRLHLRVFVADEAAKGGWAASGSVDFRLVGMDPSSSPAGSTH